MFHIEGEDERRREAKDSLQSREKEKMSGGSIERYSFFFDIKIN